MSEVAPRIVGILNLTEDSFSDGGRYLDPSVALAHARDLVRDGADIVELGPASSHPDAKDVTPEEEIRRLEPIVSKLIADGITVGVDSFLSETQRWCQGQGVAYLNDIQGFPDPAIWPVLAKSSCRLIVMHSVQGRGRATRVKVDASGIMKRIETFFVERITQLEAAGIARDRLILDPGMGFFLGDAPDPSVAVLSGLATLRDRFSLPLWVSVSRKSFLGALCRDPDNGEDRPVAERLPATLASELFAARQGASYIRTHDARSLSDALRIERVLTRESHARVDWDSSE